MPEKRLLGLDSIPAGCRWLGGVSKRFRTYLCPRCIQDIFPCKADTTHPASEVTSLGIAQINASVQKGLTVLLAESLGVIQNFRINGVPLVKDPTQRLESGAIPFARGNPAAPCPPRSRTRPSGHDGVDGTAHAR